MQDQPKNSSQILLKTVQETPNLQAIQNQPLGSSQQLCTTVGRPAWSTANGQKSDRWASGRPARSTEAWNREQTVSAGRSARSTGAFQRAEALWRSTGSVDRPSSQTGVHVLCTSVNRLGRPTSSSVDRSGRPTEARSGIFGKRKLDILTKIKSHKFMKNLQKQFQCYALIIKHACTKSRHVTNKLDFFCYLEILAQNKNCIFLKFGFSKTYFSKLHQIQKQDILNIFKAQCVWI